MKIIKLNIAGMHCSSCETLIKEELKELSGVSNLEVDFKSGKASLELNTDLNTEEDIIGAIANAGYKTELEKEEIV